MILDKYDHQTRVKVLLVSREALVRMVVHHRNTGGTWRLTEREELPAGTRVLAVTDDMEFRCFRVLVTHPSFDEVPVGQQPPTFGTLMDEWVYLPSQEEALVQATQQRDNLLAAIAQHHAQRADDRCWMDDEVLYQLAGLPKADVRVGDKAAMLVNCRQFIQRRCDGGHWPTYAELTAIVTEVHDWWEHTANEDMPNGLSERMQRVVNANKETASEPSGTSTESLPEGAVRGQ